MAATWVSTSGVGMTCAACQQISMSWRAAWKTLMTFSFAIRSKNGVEVDALGERVDHHGLVAARDLGDAELGIIGGLALELGVDRHERMLREAGAGFGELLGGGDRLHAWTLIAQAVLFLSGPRGGRGSRGAQAA